MKVRALKSFGGTTDKGRFHVPAGSVVEMPEGADWLRAGFVEAIEPEENAAMPAPKPRKTQAEPVTAIHGIGPSTAQELEDLGIETVADLAAAEDLPEELARWQEEAREYLR